MSDPLAALDAHFSSCALAAAPQSLAVPRRHRNRPAFEGLFLGLALAMALATWTPVLDLEEARSGALILASRQMPQSDRLAPVELGALPPRRPERLA